MNHRLSKLLSSLILGLALVQPVLADERLIFSVDIVRHGDRNPGTEIPKSPYSWIGGLNSLTKTGIDREYSLGETLRKEYIDKFALLPIKYQPDTLYVRSTDTERTIGSAKALLDGLYPNSFRSGKDILIHTEKMDKDDLLLVRPSSNIFSIIKVFFWKKNIWKEKTAGLQNELRQWSEASGLPLDNWDDLDALADNLFIRLFDRVPLPPGLDQKNAETIVKIDQELTVATFELPEISKPTGLKLLKTVKTYFDEALHKKSPLKCVLFSAHDATIMAALGTLGNKFSKTPDFASRLNFKLFQRDNLYSIKVTLNGQPIHIPECNGSICSISQFSKILEDK